MSMTYEQLLQALCVAERELREARVKNMNERDTRDNLEKRIAELVTLHNNEQDRADDLRQQLAEAQAEVERLESLLRPAYHRDADQPV